MKIDLSTPLKNIKLSKESLDFWRDKLMAKYHNRYSGYSPFSTSYDRGLSSWSELVSKGKTVNDLFDILSSFHRSENSEFNYNEVKNTESSMYLSVQMLDILRKDNIDLGKIILDKYAHEPSNSERWYYMGVFNIYLDYLNYRNETIPEILKTHFISELKDAKGYSSHRSVDEDINTYFSLLKVIPKNKITYEWFSENLDTFCLIENENGELENACKYLNYDSQKKIHDYISDNFPSRINDNEKYYPNLLQSDVFSTKRFHQGSIDIKIFPLIQQYNLNQKDVKHLSNIAVECLNVVASDEFMKLIGENIPISNIETKDQHSNVILNFSTDTYENLEKVEKILLTALKGVLEVSHKINMSWSEDYHTGENILMTNMNAKFVHQYYMFHNLHDTLDTNNSKGKRNKI